MAIRLEQAGWSNAEFWLRRRTTCDLVRARKREDLINVERYQPPPDSVKWQGTAASTGECLDVDHRSGGAAGASPPGDHGMRSWTTLARPFAPAETAGPPGDIRV